MTAREAHDVYWDRLMEDLDLQAGDLDAIEARLNEVPISPLPVATAQRMVREATHGAPHLRLHQPATPPRRKKIVAALLGLGLTAAGVATVCWIWPEGQHSSRTMTYSMMLELLAGSNESEEDRMSAMTQVQLRIGDGIDALLSLRATVSLRPELQRGATLGIERLRQLLTVDPPTRFTTFHEDLRGVVAAISDTSLSVEIRALELERLILAVGADIGELRTMPNVSGDLSLALKAKLAHLKRKLVP